MILGPLRLEHTRELYASPEEAETWRYMSMKAESEADLERWISRRVEAVKRGTALAFIQREAKSRAGFGSTSIFDINQENRRAEISHTWVDARHRRTAPNTEAKLLLFKHAFESLGL